MRIKYLFIYIGIGAAFLAASLWVFLSGGKNARAIRAKYKLGGALLTTWALLSAATCGPRIGGGHPEVLCYDMPCPVNEVSIADKKDGDNNFSAGDVLSVEINYPRCDSYQWQITDAERKTVLQEGSIQYTGEDYGTFQFEITLKTGTFKGPALLVISGTYPEAEAPEAITALGFTLQ